MMYTKISAVLAMAASVSGHLIISKPVPFDFVDTMTQQFPLEPTDFPCKQPAGQYVYTTMNQYKAGDDMEVKIIGGATHSGGSCQVSITTDKKPTKDSQWKVIFSQIGSCPNAKDGNVDGSAEYDQNPPINVTIPKDLPDGQYTMAWTWNNKSGNREFYMNCAPIEVSGGGSGDVSTVLGSLPDMFVINMPSTECELIEGQDALYPNPGKAVVTGSAASPGLKVKGTGCGTQTKLGAGAGQLGSPSQATGSPAASSYAAGSKPTSVVASQPATSVVASQPATSVVASQPATSVVVSQPATSAVYQPATSAAASQPATSAAYQPSVSIPGVYAPGAASSTAAAQPTGSTSSPSTGSSSGTSCSENGALVCIGSTQFGICSNGVVIPQALAAGTTCSNGAISRRSVFSA
ncbi:hypothetical protein P280DRAFT_14164 [Massarina eburnea CBS 473.64]|uniref:AA9 family lytic polysaccharide monooxygenase n=1 Tax=Massarina eburnea CBS 473.64 TaxID=1395130 RepID=A0A6A6SJL1_9PLEO|nr:hypothetical protein P280DRAFT_14164 [Massarina eburnea CBS 473.64]